MAAATTLSGRVWRRPIAILRSPGAAVVSPPAVRESAAAPGFGTAEHSSSAVREYDTAPDSGDRLQSSQWSPFPGVREGMLSMIGFTNRLP